MTTTGPDVHASVVKALEAVLGTSLAAAGPDTRLFEELGLDSPGVLELLVVLEDDHGIEIDTDRLVPEHLATIGAVSAFLAGSGDRSAGG